MFVRPSFVCQQLYDAWTCSAAAKVIVNGRVDTEICVQSIYLLAPNDRTLSEIPTLINRTLTDASSYLEIGDHLTLLAHTITFRWHESLDTLDLFRHQVFSVDQFVLFPVSIANGRQSQCSGYGDWSGYHRLLVSAERGNGSINGLCVAANEMVRLLLLLRGGQQITTFLRDLFYSG